MKYAWNGGRVCAVSASQLALLTKQKLKSCNGNILNELAAMHTRMPCVCVWVDGCWWMSIGQRIETYHSAHIFILSRQQLHLFMRDAFRNRIDCRSAATRYNVRCSVHAK